jgi:hypothetical protein
MEDIQEYTKPLALDDAYAASPKVSVKFPYEAAYTLTKYGYLLVQSCWSFFSITSEIKFCNLKPLYSVDCTKNFILAPKG